VSGPSSPPSGQRGAVAASPSSASAALPALGERGERLAGAITIDVEEYFHVENLRAAAPPAAWEAFPSRIDAQVDRLLALLARRRTRGTFFTLGWIAERNPRLVARIAAAGHEIASHGYGHAMLGDLGPEAFRADLRRARAALEDAAQQPIAGYRAPTWSLGPATDWAFDVLVEEGYRYSSSVFPVRHDRYGDPSAPLVPHRRTRAGGSIVEVPPLVLRLAGMNLPAAGGGYLRLFPLAYVRAATRQAAAEGRPAVLYLHPWEVDPDQPRLPVSFARRIRHYAGLGGTEAKLDALLRERPYGRMCDLVAAFEAAPC
jgi:polysaccharide deacetylase family protein (PEP-CTERM system associated)